VQQAEQRCAIFQRLQLVNHGFLRALEMWLVLDLAVYLQEGDCELALTQFCSRELSPRNLRLLAKR
jgi:hypothetical protein